MKEKCPKCGRLIKSDSRFCPFCGFNMLAYHNMEKDINEYKSPKQHQQAFKNLAPTNKPHKPQSKNKVALIVAIIIILIGGYSWCNNYFSESNQISRIAKELTYSNNKILGKLDTDSTTIPITEESVRPVIRYFKSHKHRAYNLKTDIQETGSYGNYTIERDGSYLLFFPKYKLVIPTVTSYINTNHENTSIKVDGRDLGTAPSSYATTAGYQKKFGPHFPGTYKISVQVKGSNNLKDEAEADLTHNKATLDESLYVDDFSVVGPKGGELYIDGKSEGTFGSDNIIKLTNFCYTNSTNYYVETDNEDSEVKNLSKNLTQINPSSTMTEDNVFYNDETKALLNWIADHYKTNNVVYSQFDLSTKSAESKLANAVYKTDPDQFTNGSSNQYYQTFNKMKDNFNDSDKIKNWGADAMVDGIRPVGDDEYVLDHYYLIYVFEHKDNYHLQIAKYNKAVFKLVDGKYKIEKMGSGYICYDKTFD